MPILPFKKPHKEYEEGFYPEENIDDEYDEEEYEEEYDDEEEEASYSNRDEYTLKVKRHRRAVLLRTILATIFLIGLVAFIIYQFDTRIFSEGSIENVADIIRPNAAVYRSLNGKVFCYSRDGANCMDSDGKALWNITYEMQQPMADINGSVAAIADYNGSTVYVVSADSVIGTIETNMPIRAISVSESGEVAAVLADSEITWVYLYNKEGDEIAYFRMSMNQAGYPMSVSISPNGELVCVSHLRADNADIKSSIAFYNFGVVGQNEIDNYVSGYDYLDEVVPIIGFFSDSAAFAISDSRLLTYSGKEIPQLQADVLFAENVLSVFHNNKYIGVLFPDVTGEYQYRLDVYNARGDLSSSISFTMDFTDIQMAYDRIYIYDEQMLMIYDVDGTKKFEGAFGKSVDVLFPSSRIDKMAVITNDGLEKLTLN